MISAGAVLTANIELAKEAAQMANEAAKPQPKGLNFPAIGEAPKPPA